MQRIHDGRCRNCGRDELLNGDELCPRCYILSMRTDYDVWFCDECQREWIVRAVPQRQFCPDCGIAGWWRRMRLGPAYDPLGG